MTIIDMQMYADDSGDHRNVSDPDVATAIHEVQKWAEVERLRDEGRL
jgi:hypothetical protein